MPNKKMLKTYFSDNKQFVIVMTVYAVLAFIFGVAYRYGINPDGLCHVRLAGYIADGNFQMSVTRGWSPLISWIISLFIFLGFQGLIAARIAVAMCGAGLLVVSWFLALRFDLSQNFRFISALIAALLISFWTIQYISSDVLFAALIISYLYVITDPDILKRKKIVFICGITGGVSYLAHHYAFPFFMVHFPLILILRAHMDKEESALPWKNTLLSWVAGVAGFMLIASLWVGIMSAKYGELTISSKAPVAHAALGPPDVDRSAPHFYGGLNKPENEYSIHVFEDPSGLKFNTWSPFESKEYFMHQLKLIKDNIVYILDHFVKKSPFFTYAFVIGIFALIPFSLLLSKLDKRKKFLYLWVTISFCVFSSGYILIIARSPRRFYAFMIVFIFLCFHFLEELDNSIANILSEKRRKFLTVYFMILLVGAFTIKPAVQLMKSSNNIFTGNQINPYSDIAEQILTVDFPSPYAIIRSSQKPTTDYYLTYYLNKQLLGRPLSEDIDGITKELKTAGAKSILVFDNMNVVVMLKSDDRYIHIASIKLKDNKQYDTAMNISYQDHEIITGWDSDVNVFRVK